MSSLTLIGSHWQLAPAVDAQALLYAALYVFAVRRARRWPAWRTASFLAGIGCVVVALQSGLDTYDDRLLSAHMVQHLLLLDLAPLLLLGGGPVALALRTLPRPWRRRLARGLSRARVFTGPLVCLAIYYVVVLGTHVPVVFDATLRHPLLHACEHALFLLCGVLMWWPVHDGDPVASRRLGGLQRFVYVLVAMLPMDAIGAWLNRAPTVVYSSYAHTVGAVTDQQQAGAIMWVGASTLMIAVGLWASISAMLAAERGQRARDARELVA